MPEKKAIRPISLVIAIIMMISLLVSCGKGGNDTSDIVSDTTSETSTPDSQTGITVDIDGTTFAVNAVNSSYDGLGVALYDRNYVSDGKPALYLPGTNEGRYILIVKRSVSDNTEGYTILDKIEGKGKKEKIYIPVNGFTLSVDASLIPENFKVKTGAKITVTGYNNKPSYERLDLATVIPEDRTKTRRINMTAPVDGIFEEDKIYYVSKNDTVTVPENAVAVILDQSTGSNFSVEEIVESGSKISGKYALIFTGEYNVSYAKEFYAETKMYFTRLEQANGITDVAAVKIGENYYTFDNGHINTSEGNDGIFLYTTENSSLITDSRPSFVDVVVVGGKVCYISPENTRTLIPTSHGFVLSFAGNNKDMAKEIKMGDTIENLLIKDTESPDKFVRINGTNYPWNAMNTAVSQANPVVLYTTAYGSSTGNGECLEFAIQNGKVISVSTAGNSTIPENGYVLAIAKTGTVYSNPAKNIEVGDVALISVVGNQYGYSSFNYTAINGIRHTNYIVIYDGKEGKTTGTNIYGYEVSVNAEGKMVSASYAGNMEIPTGGFVISVHGDANIDMLKNMYMAGANVSLDKTTKTVSVYTSPDLMVYSTAVLLDEQKAAFDNAKSRFYSINYSEVSSSLTFAQNTLDQADAAFKSGDIAKAAELANGVTPVLEKLRFSLYESAPVENRSVWYRAYEKSDEDVYKTIRLMADMNINAVYIEAWYNGKVIGYSENSLIGHHTAAHGNYDALEGFCRIGHEFGIEIHVWVENFFIGTDTGDLVKATQGYHLLDKAGRNYCPTMYGNFVFLNPYEEYSQNLVMGVYREMIEKYDIDGLHLDYIRFPEPNPDGADFGYNDNIITGFQQAYNTTVNPKNMTSNSKDWNNWCLFREGIINDWVAKVYAMAKSLDPDIIMSCAVSNHYPGSRTTIFQNFNAWVEAGYMDEVFSMSYTTSLTVPVDNIKTFTKYTDGKCYYSIGLSAFEVSPDYILVEQVKLSREAGAFGQNLFSWGSLIIHEENYFDALRMGVYSRKSVQTYRLSETVSAYAERLVEDVDSVYAYLKPIEGDFYSKVKSQAQALVNQAKAFDLEKSTKEAKTEYCQNAISALGELKTLMESCPEKDVSKAMVEDINFIIDCLNTSLVRLSK